MPTIEQGEVTYKDLGYSKNLSKDITASKSYVSQGETAGGDLTGFYPRPQVAWGKAKGFVAFDGQVAMKEVATNPTAIVDTGILFTKSDNKLYFTDGSGSTFVVHGGIPQTKSYNVTTQGLGASPDIYAAGYYEASAADANLSEGATTQAYGDANRSYAAHAFVVTSGAGSVDTGVVGLRVTGTSINDSGTRTTSDSETIISDITQATTNGYYEAKKWLGTVTFELFVVSGSPTTYSLDFNYGFCKYDDLGNNDFTLTDVEAVGFAGANDSDVDIKLIHHKSTGWTYHATAFDPVNASNVICSLAGDHSTDDNVDASGSFAWKRANLDTAIDGSNSEGYLIQVTSSANNAIEYLNIHVGVTD